MTETQGIVINTATLVNVALWVAFATVAVLIVRWVVAWALWKWQDMIDKRAEEKLPHRHEDDGDDGDDSPPPPTHWTSKKPRRRNVN